MAAGWCLAVPAAADKLHAVPARAPWSRWVAIASLGAMFGLPWALLQTAAWTSMFVRHARTAPLQVAWSRTFDGLHPCPLCLVVQEGRADQKARGEQERVRSPRLDWLAVADIAVSGRDPLPGRPPGPPALVVWTARSESPPLPPPRGA